jgi:hypothetical protein
MPDGLSVFSFAPAMKIIGRTIGKIFNRLYTVLAERGEHSRRYAWNSTLGSFRLASKFASIRFDERGGSELGTKSV